MPPKTKGEYIETDTGNKVSRRSQIHGTQNIILGGKSVIQAEVCIRGDLKRIAPPAAPSGNSLQPPEQKPSSGPSNVAVSIGRYCIFSPRCLLRPPSKISRSAGTSTSTSAGGNANSVSTTTPTTGTHVYYPLKIGDHVFVGSDATVEAAVVGNYVRVGERAVIGRFAIIKDFVHILPDTVVPPNMVVPSFSIVAGAPGRVVAEMGEAAAEEMDCRELYRSIN